MRVLCLFLLFGTILSIGTEGSEGKDIPTIDGWVPSKCDVTSVYSQYDCYSETDCRPSFVITNSSDFTVPTKCKPCSFEDYFNMTTCQDLINKSREGDCCHHEDYCCVSDYDQDCVKSINSYYCKIERRTCFDMEVNIFDRVNTSITFYPECSPDDIKCMEIYIGKWGNYNGTRCWVKNGEIRFSDPCYDPDVKCDKGLGSLDIFLIAVCSILGAMFISIIILAGLKYRMRIKSNEDDVFLLPPGGLPVPAPAIIRESL